MAKIASFIVQGGSFDGVRIISRGALDEMHANQVKAEMFGRPGSVTYLTQGGVNFYNHDETEPQLGKRLRNGYVGWTGAGGSVLQWHPEHKIGIGFARTLCHWYDFQNVTAAEFQAEIVKCVKNIAST